MIAVRSQTETRRGGPVPGLDQPSSRNPTAALPLVGRVPYVPCTPCGERGATGWGVALRCNAGPGDVVQRDGGMPTGPMHAAVTCFECCGHGFVEKSYSPIRDKCKMNLLSR